MIICGDGVTKQRDLNMIVLSGDIGGTNSRLQLTDFTNKNKSKVICKKYYKSVDYKSFLDIIDEFLRYAEFSSSKLFGATFGVAGPIVDETVKLTNLPWLIDVKSIKSHLKLKQVSLINDFCAIGYGIETLDQKDLYVLQSGKLQKNGVKSFIGAGTGLGMGFVSYHDGDGIYDVNQSEGGHVDFAPCDELQIELLQYLRKKYGRVSLERVLSGSGLANIYEFIRERSHRQEELEKKSTCLECSIEQGRDVDISATIVDYAINHKDKCALEALDVFIRIYGASVGNFALITLPYGGLYIVGGIASKLLQQIKTDHFLELFSNKGRMSGLVSNIPLYVVLNPDVGLQGAAIHASRTMSGK